MCKIRPIYGKQKSNLLGLFEKIVDDAISKTIKCINQTNIRHKDSINQFGLKYFHNYLLCPKKSLAYLF